MIDDFGADVGLVERLLAGAGFTDVTGTTDLAWGLRSCAHREPDLIVLVLSAPHLGGSEFMLALEEVAPEETFQPVLIITADPTHGVRQQAASCGATEFMGHPLDASELLARTMDLLETRFFYRQLDWENSGAWDEHDHAILTILPSERAAI